MKFGKVWVIIVFVILVGGFVLFSNSSLKQSKIVQSSVTNNQIAAMKETAKVIRVVDGDTIKVEINNKEDTVRLIGIDAPETVDPRKPVQCFGKEASSKAKEILTGKTIVLESDLIQGERDKYGRLLRYVFINTENFNLFMISSGFAHEYAYRDNPYKYQAEFMAAEKSARESKKGLWSSDACG